MRRTVQNFKKSNKQIEKTKRAKSSNVCGLSKPFCLQ